MNQFFTYQDRRYMWFGGLGAVFFGYEYRFLPRTRTGEVRYIRGHLFYAYMVSLVHPFKWEISWCPVDKDKQDFNWIREFKKEVLEFA